MIGTSDQSCWLAEACKILLLLLLCTDLLHAYINTWLPSMLFRNVERCLLQKSRWSTELTGVGGSLDSVQQRIILGIECNGEGTVHNVSIDLGPKICSTLHPDFAATWRNVALMRSFVTVTAL